VSGASSELGLAVSRIGAGIILFFVFRCCFQGLKAFTSFPYALAAFLFGVWNLVYNPMIGNPFAAPGIETVILALAPAVFEEVIFRGIGVWFLKERGYSDPAVTGISGLLFGLAHLTNIAGMNLQSVLLQTGYAVVVGLVFAALYVKSDDFVSLVLAHFFIDFTNRLFLHEITVTPIPWVAAFAVLMLAEAFFAVWIIRKDKNA
jgi:membrane protease YdiL (CAAX protease family)